MNRISLRAGLHFWLKGREYMVKKHLAQGDWQIVEVTTEVISTIKQTALIQLLFRGELTFEPQLSSKSLGQKSEYLKADFTQIPSELRDEAKRKYQYVNRVIELNINKRNQASLQPIIDQVSIELNDLGAPSWVTLYRWLKTYIKSGQDIRSLIPRHQAKGDYRPKLKPEVIAIINRAISQVYLTPIRPDIADVYDEVILQIRKENQNRQEIGMEPLKIPHRSTVYRTVSNLDPSEVAVGRYGKKRAAQMYNPVSRGPRPTRPLERVEIDHTKLPLFVVDTESRMPIGTPWLTSAIDKYSGITLGYYLSFSPPSYLSVMQCLLHAVQPKNYLHAQYPQIQHSWNTYGLPEVIVVDNGKEFKSTHFEDACLSLGIVIQYSPPYMPWYKSAIERYFGALNSQLLSDKPGKKFANFMEQYDYDPIKDAVISFKALQEILHLFIVDIHNQSEHPELRSPRGQVWDKAIEAFPPALPPDSQLLSVLMGCLTERTITRRGIELFGLIYNSSKLAHLRSILPPSSQTKIKYNPTDLSVVYVFDQTTHQFIEVPALNQEYTQGLTLWQHKVVKKLACQEAEKVDIVALALAKEKIQKIVEQEWKKTKKGKTRQSMARWLGIGTDGLIEPENSCSKIQEQPEIGREIESTELRESQALAGISDLNSALNCPPKPTGTKQTRVSEKSDLKLNHQERKNQGSYGPSNKKKKAQESPSKPDAQLSQKESEFQPDLTGWDVTYGLPK